MGYETAQHIDDERAILTRLGQKMGCNMVRFGSYSAIDAIAFADGHPVALIEVKKRNLSYAEMRRLKTVFVDLTKIEDGQLIAAKLYLKFYFVVKLTDALLRLHIRSTMVLTDFAIDTIQLNNARDVHDRDVVIHFPVEIFEVIDHDPSPLPAGSP